VAVEKAVDQMQIARPAASGTDRQFADQVTDNAVDPFDAGDSVSNLKA
jgi:hypothetical protein